jgi:type I restriction enzyme, S subunit
MSEWQRCKLCEQINLKRGYDLPIHLRVDGCIPIYSSSGVTGFHSEKKCIGPGVIAGRYGTIGQIFFSRGEYWPLNTTLYVQDFKGNDEHFIYYFLQQLDWEKYNDKSAVPGVNRNDVHQEEIYLPPLAEQKAIAQVLSSLDDKIDLLHRQNKTLEAIAETLFRQWFIEEAQDNWEEEKLEDYISVKHGYAFKGKFISQDRSDQILVTPGNFEIGGGFKAEKIKYYHDADFPEGYILGEDDLVVTMTDLSKQGDTLGYPALIPASNKSTYLHNQRIGKVVFNSNLSKYFLYFLMRTAQYHWYILGISSGTSVRHTSPSSICNYSFLTPPESKMNKFDVVARNLLDKVSKNTSTIDTLEKFRDTLLPKLMSGEVRVKLN